MTETRAIYYFGKAGCPCCTDETGNARGFINAMCLHCEGMGRWCKHCSQTGIEQLLCPVCYRSAIEA